MTDTVMAQFRSTAILMLNLGSTEGWEVSPTFWPLYPKRKGWFTDCRRGWVEIKAVLDRLRYLDYRRDSTMGKYVRVCVAMPTELPRLP